MRLPLSSSGLGSTDFFRPSFSAEQRSLSVWDDPGILYVLQSNLSSTSTVNHAAGRNQTRSGTLRIPLSHSYGMAKFRSWIPRRRMAIRPEC